MKVLRVWRLCAAQYADTAYDGRGARLYGGRWSPRGIPLAYAAESRALAAMEVLAHVDEPGRLTERAWVLVSADLPADLVEFPPRVPDTWRRYPHTDETRAFGAAWANQQRSAALRVPSALVPGEFNYLLNPLHPDFKRVSIGSPEPFSFDPRFGRRE